MDCIFCKIAQHTIPAKIIYEDDDFVAFNDQFPKAPIHILIIPRRHIATLDDLTDEDALLAGRLLLAAQKIAKQLGLDKQGYRVISNCKEGAGQTVFHIHLHVLGGGDVGSFLDKF